MRFFRSISAFSLVTITATALVASCSGAIDNSSSSSASSSGSSGSTGGTGDGSCTAGNRRLANGESYNDGCNTCQCINGATSCTTMYCPPADASVGVCKYDGKQYPAGASFPSTDGCNTCGCSSDGSVACTKKACAVDAGTKDAGYTCPPDGTIDCMPIVSPKNQAYCSSPYRAWIEANCPGVKFVD